MKGKCLKNTQRKKGRPSLPESVSQRKRSRGKLGWDPRKCQSPDAQHSPNKIPMVEEKNRISSVQSWSEGSEKYRANIHGQRSCIARNQRWEKQKKKVKAAGRELSNQQQKILAIWEKWQEWKAAKKLKS